MLHAWDNTNQRQHRVDQKEGSSVPWNFANCDAPVLTNQLKKLYTIHYNTGFIKCTAIRNNHDLTTNNHCIPKMSLTNLQLAIYATPKGFLCQILKSNVARFTQPHKIRTGTNLTQLWFSSEISTGYIDVGLVLKDIMNDFYFPLNNNVTAWNRKPGANCDIAICIS